MRCLTVAIALLRAPVRRCFLSAGALAVLLSGCGGDPTPATVPAERAAVELGPVTAAGLQNVFRLSEKLYSGSSPEGDEGFESLRRLGIKTIVTVDGMRPDVERAHKFGLRYVHLPVGYDGVPPEQGLRIAKAVRDLPGPIYLHCHHGQHRAPAAAAVARVCLDEHCGVEQAVAEMRRAGTDPHYAGLYASPGQVRRPASKEEWDRIPDDFPEVSEAVGLTEVMIGIDERWDRLKLVRAAGWKTPPDHPDIDPPHEALMLIESYREAARLPDVKGRSDDFRRRLAEVEKDAQELEKALRQTPASDGAAKTSFQKVAASCTNCHAIYRDVPHKR